MGTGARENRLIISLIEVVVADPAVKLSSRGTK